MVLNREPRTVNWALRAWIRTLFLILLALIPLLPCAAWAAVPAAPTNLTAAALSPSQIRLEWTDNSSDEQYFLIEIMDANGVFSQWNWTYPDVTSLVQDYLEPGTSYTFRVAAFNADGTTYSNTATATTVAIPAPVITSITAVSTSELEITWTDNRPDVMQYEIEITGGPNGWDWRQADGSATSLIISYLYPNTEYTVKVRSMDFMWMYSPYSNEAKASTLSDTAAPILSATALSSKRIKLTWTDPTTNETAYYVEYRKGTASFIPLEPLPADTVSYVHANLEEGVAYTYRVRSYNGSYYGPYSNEAAVTTPGCVGEGKYIK